MHSLWSEHVSKGCLQGTAAIAQLIGPKVLVSIVGSIPLLLKPWCRRNKTTWVKRIKTKWSISHTSYIEPQSVLQENSEFPSLQAFVKTLLCMTFSECSISLWPPASLKPTVNITSLGNLSGFPAEACSNPFAPREGCFGLCEIQHSAQSNK